VRLDQPRDLPRVPRHLKRHSIIRAKALSEHPYLLWLGLEPPGGANLTILDDCDLTEIQTHIQRD